MFKFVKVYSMKAKHLKYLLITAMLVTPSFVSAQESLFSVSAAYRSEFVNFPWMLELHGGSVNENIMFRLGVEVPSLIIMADASYIYDIADTGLRLYGGVGADAAAFIIVAFGLHAHAGLEFKQDNVALFTEYQLSGFVSGMPREENAPDLVFGKFKAGLTFYTPTAGRK